MLDDAAIDEELRSLDNLGLVVDDAEIAERAMRIVAVVAALYDGHRFDRNGRCGMCRPDRRRLLWRRGQPCTIHAVFVTYRLGVSAGQIAGDETEVLDGPGVDYGIDASAALADARGRAVKPRRDPAGGRGDGGD